jgi:hypothetical protein
MSAPRTFRFKLAMTSDQKTTASSPVMPPQDPPRVASSENR